MDKEQKIFTDIYKGNKFRGKESVSGNGSGDEQTMTIRIEIPKLFVKLGISSILDIPCGDFYWMNMIDLEGIEYTGMDIVDPLIKSNNERFNIDGINFKFGNLILDKLPKVDIILCRDCLVHLSYDDINSSLQNIIDSGSMYLLTTTFTRRESNINIDTGGWRTLNLMVEPFNFPQPEMIIVENCTEGEGGYTDKSLGLWSIDKIKRGWKRSTL